MRESCVNHAPKTRSVIIKSDYLEICSNDHCEAALLSLIEFWANGAIANRTDRPSKIELGKFTSKDLHWWLLGFYSTKRIMQRIDKLQSRGFIQFEESANHKIRRYWADIDAIQSALNQPRQMSEDKCLESDYPRQMSEEESASPDICLDKTELVQTNVSSSIFSNSSISNEELVTPLIPQGEHECKSCCIDLVGVDEEVNPPLSQEQTSSLTFVENKTNSGIDQFSGRVTTKQRSKSLTKEELQYFLDAYRAEKPSNFVEHRDLSEKHVKAINRLAKQYGIRALDIFVGALRWVREDKNDWWRNATFSLDNLISNGKLTDYADKHFFAMENDQAYCDRIEGRAKSSDKARNDHFSVIDKDGNQATGVMAECAAAAANNPMLQMILGVKIND